MKKLPFLAVAAFCALFVGCGGEKPEKNAPKNPPLKIIPDTTWYKKNNMSIGFYKINTAEELAGLAILVEDDHSMIGRTIKLGANISFAPKSRSADNVQPYLWQAIGSADKPFKGTFDGNGFVISGIHLYTVGEHSGFFGFIDEAEIKNLTLSDLYVDTRLNFAGGLVGCSRTSRIYNCAVSGEVKSTGNYVGGLVGYNDGSEIKDSYSMCKVSGNLDVGGLVGCSVGNISSITNCYSTGAVSAKINGGGLVGENSAGIKVKNCYYDKETSGQTDTSKGEARTTAQMKQEGNYAGWNFVDIWKVSASKNGGYPYLYVNEVLRENKESDDDI